MKILEKIKKKKVGNLLKYLMTLKCRSKYTNNQTQKTIVH